MADFKDSYSATLKDSVRIQRRFQKTLDGWDYLVGIFGSTVTKGKGSDIDVLIIAAMVATIPAHRVAAEILSKHSKHLFSYDEIRYADDTDILACFETYDGFYIDLFLKGLT